MLNVKFESLFDDIFNLYKDISIKDFSVKDINMHMKLNSARKVRVWSLSG